MRRQKHRNLGILEMEIGHVFQREIFLVCSSRCWKLNFSSAYGKSPRGHLQNMGLRISKTYLKLNVHRHSFGSQPHLWQRDLTKDRRILFLALLEAALIECLWTQAKTHICPSQKFVRELKYESWALAYLGRELPRVRGVYSPFQCCTVDPIYNLQVVKLSFSIGTNWHSMFPLPPSVRFLADAFGRTGNCWLSPH